ncbi:MAG: DEAD/DEAH box helicase family protein, partial [Bacteroidota bacterium]
RTSASESRRKYIDKKLSAADWQDNQILAEKYFTDGPIRTIGGNKAIRKEGKKADYLLRYSRDFLIAVVEAKKKNADDGLQQAKDYAEILDLKFAYSTDGKEIIEYDYTTGLEQIIQNFPSPDELWNRLMRHQGIEPSIQEILLKPFFNVPKKPPRYYQRIAVNRAVRHTLEGTDRLLLTMATGTGKTYTAFQIIYKLWESRWNKKGEYRRPKILFLADRSILVEDPMTKEFSAFGQALYQIQGEISLGREVYFATYQSIAEDERRPGLFREFPENFFDLIVIDECHRGSARRESSWRRILNHFHSATQLGLTATPKRDDNVDTYLYFGNPIYTYSLDQGIQDGFLAPYINRRVVPSADATGWRPYRGQQDKHGREIPDGTYGTADFERSLSLLPRTKAVARHLTDFLKRTRRFAKTIIFCEDSEHANQVRRELNNLNSDLTRQYPDYVVRIVSKEGDIGRGHLSNFMDVDKETPVLVTTSKLLTTGVDVQTCKNIVIFR